MQDTLFGELAALASALAHPKRLRALNLLLQGPKPIDALAELLEESPANTAAHMKALRAGGLVTATRQGKYVVQHVSDEAVGKLLLCLRCAGERLRPALALLESEQRVHESPLTADDLLPLVEAKSVVLVDLRPREEFDVGHLPGARSAPLASIADAARSLPRRRRVLAYCRGKYCPGARHGVIALRNAGLKAEPLAFGVPEWRALGHALEVGEGP